MDTQMVASADALSAHYRRAHRSWNVANPLLASAPIWLCAFTILLGLYYFYIPALFHNLASHVLFDNVLRFSLQPVWILLHYAINFVFAFVVAQRIRASVPPQDLLAGDREVEFNCKVLSLAIRDGFRSASYTILAVPMIDLLLMFILQLIIGNPYVYSWLEIPLWVLATASLPALVVILAVLIPLQFPRLDVLKMLGLVAIGTMAVSFLPDYAWGVVYSAWLFPTELIPRLSVNLYGFICNLLILGLLAIPLRLMAQRVRQSYFRMVSA